MYYELIRQVSADKRYLIVALDKSEMVRRSKQEHAAYNHVDLSTLQQNDLKGKSLIISCSDSTAALNQVHTLQTWIQKENKGRLVFATCINAKTCEKVREYGLIHEEDLGPLNLQLVLMCGPPARVVAFMMDKYGLTEGDLPEKGAKVDEPAGDRTEGDPSPGGCPEPGRIGDSANVEPPVGSGGGVN